MSVDSRHRHDQGRTNGLANRNWTEGCSERLSSGGTNPACLDSHRPGVDGLWVCGGEVRTFPAVTPVPGAPARASVLWILTVVRYGAHRVWSNRERICRVASSSTDSRFRQGRDFPFSPNNAGCGCFVCSGTRRTSDGDLSDFDSKLSASPD